MTVKNTHESVSNSIKEEIISSIVKEMEKRSMSVSELSRVCNMDRSTVSDALNSNRASLAKIIDIASYLMLVELKTKSKKTN